MRIVDRADGRELLEASDELEELLYELVEDIQCFQVSELFLSSLAEREVDSSVIEVLQSKLALSPTLFVGGELTPDDEAAILLSGELRDGSGEGIGGLAVTLQGKDGQAIAWAFSGQDGKYRLRIPFQLKSSVFELLISARSGLVLFEYEISEIEGEAKVLEPVSVLTLEGRVVLEDGTGLGGGRIEAWGTWTITDREGKFSLPVEAVEGDVSLEIFAASGQPLGGYWTIGLDDNGSSDLGERVVSLPDPNWPDSEEPLIASFDYRPDSLFPGISEHPLG